MRGNYADLGRTNPSCLGSPPRARELRVYHRPPIAAGGDHPRVRGNYPMISTGKFVTSGSPPRARELLPACLYNCESLGITPACAGITVVVPSLIYASRDHPRVRGNYKRLYPADPLRLGSPPRARELRIFFCWIFLFRGITPACAGITLYSRRTRTRTWDHPRVRGNYWHIVASSFATSGSPPRARELLWLRTKGVQASGITPACAGITLNSYRLLVLSWDHPRVRGNYVKNARKSK